MTNSAKINVNVLYYKVDDQTLVGSASFANCPGVKGLANAVHNGLVINFGKKGSEFFVPRPYEMFNGSTYTCKRDFPGMMRKKRKGEKLRSLSAVSKFLRNNLIFPDLIELVEAGLSGDEEIIRDYGVLNNHHPLMSQDLSRTLFTCSGIYEMPTATSRNGLGIRKSGLGYRQKQSRISAS